MQSINQCKSVILTIYDIKAHGGEIKVETKEGEVRPDDPVGRADRL
ncbi:MAG TPA: hypothetical protein VK588_06770 [Chitinophagaceae bacterium]|nr:hypothetical protein [Chitinophagaceae bacterium]